MISYDKTFNKERLIENTVEVNIYYEKHKERTEIDVIGGQKWSIILKILWLACYSSEINQRIEKVKMMRYPKKCGK